MVEMEETMELASMVTSMLILAFRVEHCGQPAMWAPPRLKATATTSHGARRSPRPPTIVEHTNGAPAIVTNLRNIATIATSATTASPTT